MTTNEQSARDGLVEAAHNFARVGDYRMAYLTLCGEIGRIRTAQPNAAEPDWLHIAKSAGKHGVRYRTNTALLAFLSDIAHPPAAPSSQDDAEMDWKARFEAQLAETQRAWNVCDGLKRERTPSSQDAAKRADVRGLVEAAHRVVRAWSGNADVVTLQTRIGELSAALSPTGEAHTIMDAIEAYDFRDPKGHPLAHCVEWKALRQGGEG